MTLQAVTYNVTSNVIDGQIVFVTRVIVHGKVIKRNVYIYPINVSTELVNTLSTVIALQTTSPRR